MSQATHEEDLHARGYDHGLMRRTLRYLRPYRGQVAFAAVVVLADAVLGLAGPYLTKEAIDNGIRHRDLGHLDRVAVLYLVTLLMAFGLGYLHQQVMQRVGQHVMLDLRMALFRKLQRLPLSFYDRNPIGRLMTRVTNDVDVLNELFAAGVIALFGDLFALIGIVIAMVGLNAELLAVTLSVLPVIVVVTLIFRLKVRRSFREIRTRVARLNAFLAENLSGMSTVQLLNRESRNFEQFRTVNAAHRDANLKAIFYHALFFPLLELVGAIAVSLIVWYGGRQVMWTGITLGTLVAFLQYTQRFFRPISDLSEKYGLLQQAMASSERIFGLLDTPDDPAAARLDETPARATRATVATFGATAADGSRNGVPAAGTPAPTAASATPFLGRIEFDRVWFAYRDDHWVLQDVSFTVEPGEKVAIVGATGSGKTTLISLLLRFYAPQRGVIRVDGRPLESWDPHELRRRMGIVLQDVFLFSGTVADNLRLGRDDLSQATLEQAAREVHADDFVSRLPGGYEAAVVERGATFSAGQRQLLAFARALARDPALLVLDEATSSVDNQTEAQIQDALERLLHGRTALVIAHRLSTIQDVDRIVVLHHGRVRETGTHEELLALGGIYSRLHELQFQGTGWRSDPASGPRPYEEEASGAPHRTQIVDTRVNLT